MKIRFATLLTLAWFFFSATCQAAQGQIMSWDVDGVQRQAIVFVPTSTAGQKHPLVFAFHGHGGRMQGVARGMDFQDKWPDAIVVYPQGLPTTTPKDPAGTRPGWQLDAGEQGDRDLKFFDKMLADLKSKYPVDDKQIYATGFSNGSAFTYLLWAERGKTFAAFGITSGRIGASGKLNPARPAVIIAGQSDKVIDFTIQQSAIDTVKQVDKVSATGQACGTGCTTYASTSNTPVTTYIHDGGHVIPPWGPQDIVDFFKAHKQ